MNLYSSSHFRLKLAAGKSSTIWVRVTVAEIVGFPGGGPSLSARLILRQKPRGED